MRDDTARASSEEAAAEQYRLAVTYHEMGMVDDAIKALEGAARSPRQRFDAASMLGRVYLDRGDTMHAIEWLERAAEGRTSPALEAVGGRVGGVQLGLALSFATGVAAGKTEQGKHVHEYVYSSWEKACARTDGTQGGKCCTVGLCACGDKTGEFCEAGCSEAGSCK